MMDATIDASLLRRSNYSRRVVAAASSFIGPARAVRTHHRLNEGTRREARVPTMSSVTTGLRHAMGVALVISLLASGAAGITFESSTEYTECFGHGFACTSIDVRE